MAGLPNSQRQKFSPCTDPLTGFLNEEDFLKRLFYLKKDKRKNLCLIGIKLNSLSDILKVYGRDIGKYYLKAFSKRVVIILKQSIDRCFIKPNIFITIIDLKEKDPNIFLDNMQSFLSSPLPFRGGLLPTKIFLTICFLKKIENSKSVLDTIIKAILEEKKTVFSFDREWKTIKNSLPNYLKFSKRIIMGDLGFALQPIKDCQNKEIVFYEVLARIKEEDHSKILDAKDFLQLAEELSLKKDIERNVLYKAIFFLKKYQNFKPISINISPDYLFGDFERDIKFFLQELKVKPERIWLEITEQSHKSIADFNFKEKLLKLKNKGFKIILDDFGQYHSNINLLKEFNWDIVKIDGNFIKNILVNTFDLTFIKFLIELAKINKFQLVAEFVENEKIAQKLEKLGIDYLQGYYCGRPSFVPLSQKIIPPLIF